MTRHPPTHRTPRISKGRPAPPAHGLFRPTKIRYYLDAMAERGIAANQVLLGTGIEQRRLEDPSYLIDTGQLDTLADNMIRLSGDASLGLQIGANANLGDFGLVGFAVMSAETIGHAITTWGRYVDLIGMSSFRVEETRENCTLTIDPRKRPEHVERFFTEEYLVILHKLGAVLIGRPMVMERCTVPYAPPPHHALYEQHLGCRVVFNAAGASMTIRAPMPAVRLRGRDPEIHALCVRRCTRSLRQLTARDTVDARLRKLLMANAGQLPSLEASAAHLGISGRSLHRHLAAQGTTYRALVQQVRLELAKEYLRAEQLLPKEVAYLLGFQTVNAMRKAFKQWTGSTMTAFTRTR